MLVAIELSEAKWKIGVVLPGSQKMSRISWPVIARPAPALRYPTHGLSASLPLAARAHRFRPS